jgi:regulator of replication initiation timing
MRAAFGFLLFCAFISISGRTAASFTPSPHGGFPTIQPTPTPGLTLAPLPKATSPQGLALQIWALQNFVKQLQGQVKTLQSQTGTLQSQNAALTKRNSALQSQVTKLSGQLSTLSADVSRVGRPPQGMEESLMNWTTVKSHMNDGVIDNYLLLFYCPVQVCDKPLKTTQRKQMKSK